MIHNYKKCIKCGSRFLEVRESELCSECRVKEEKSFIKVKEYIYDNPSANLAEVSDHTEVPEEDIVRWQKEKKITDFILPPIRCDICGKAIKEGRICSRCQSGLRPDTELE